MRLLHTSDWHLGRAFHRVSMLGAQAEFIGHLVATVRERAVDAVVVSGDVYDRAVPPLAAVELFDDALHRLAGLGVPTVMISGNHDSARRLGAVQHGTGLGRLHRGGLFADHMLSGLQGRQRLVKMQPRWGADIDDIDIGHRQQVGKTIGLVRHIEFCRHRRPAPGVEIAHRDHLEFVRVAGIALENMRPPEAEADDSADDDLVDDEGDTERDEQRDKD